MKSVTQFAPFLMLTLYMTLYIFVENDFYYLNHKLFAFIDTILLVISLLGVLFYFKSWRFESIMTLSTVLVLNLITEIDLRYPIEVYYELYESVILNHFILLIIISIFNKDKNDSNLVMD